jgi:hypothetical protein
MRINSVVKYKAKIVLTTAQRFEVLRRAMQYEVRKTKSASHA